jgi:hypothetical protein
MSVKGKETSKKNNQHIPLIVGIGLMLLIAVFAYFVPLPSSWQQGVFLTILALAAAGIAAIIPGFIEVQYKGLLRAGGAIAVFCIVYFFKPQLSVADQSFSLTVLVHGPNSKQELILENKGRLVIDFGDDRRKVLIGEYGRTVFAGIPGKLRNQKVSIGLDAPGFEILEPNKEFLLDDKPIYLPIKEKDRQNTVLEPGELNEGVSSPKRSPVKSCTLVGIIKDKSSDKVVSKAKITILCDTILRSESSSDGSFSILIPGQLKGEQCLIRVESNGKSKEAYIPLCDPNPVELKID